MYTRLADPELRQELINCQVVANGLDGLVIDDGVDLMTNLIKNADRIDRGRWLEWLTTRRKLARIAQMPIDIDWINVIPIPSAKRRMLVEETMLPVSQSGDSWICASLCGLKDYREKWEADFNTKIVMIAPTLHELGIIRKAYPV